MNISNCKTASIKVLDEWVVYFRSYSETKTRQKERDKWNNGDQRLECYNQRSEKLWSFDDKLIAYRDPDQASEEMYRKGEVKWPLLMECSMAVLSGWMSIDWCPFLPLKRCDTTNGMWPRRWSLGLCRGDFTQGQCVKARVQRVTVIAPITPT